MRFFLQRTLFKSLWQAVSILCKFWQGQTLPVKKNRGIRKPKILSSVSRFYYTSSYFFSSFLYNGLLREENNLISKMFHKGNIIKEKNEHVSRRRRRDQNRSKWKNKNNGLSYIKCDICDTQAQTYRRIFVIDSCGSNVLHNY